MTVVDYLKKLEDICKKDFMTDTELVYELGIVHQTLIRIRRNPELCSMRTMKKIKRFVDIWEAKNLSVIH
jgi:hypothetical protein